jgi:hypothetical protein
MADGTGGLLQAPYRQMFDQEVLATRAALGSLAQEVDEMQACVVRWSGHTSGGVMDQLFVIEPIRDLGRLKQRSDAAIKKLAVHAVGDPDVSASTGARDLGVAQTTATRWLATP